MIKSWYTTGDIHGSLYALQNVECVDKSDEAVIILGDVGFNYYLNERDKKAKEIIMNTTRCYYYCLRGNHEARPQSISGMQKIYDENVQNWVYMEPEYPRIRYFLDYGVYVIGGYRVAIIGGAYSVDKWYRLAKAGLSEENNNPKVSGWFPDEQLTPEEMKEAELLFETSPKFDFVMSHTAPLAMRPLDKFLSFIDQSKVDTTMEVWLEKLRYKIKVKYAWLMGHYHIDRIEGPHFEYFYYEVENIEDIAKRWREYNETQILDTVRDLAPLCAMCMITE